MTHAALQDQDPHLELALPVRPDQGHILNDEALEFVARMVQRFAPKLETLLANRTERQNRFDAGGLPGFDPETVEIRDGDWRVAKIPDGIRDRRTEITGPVSRKMVINALNSGAKVYMADFEDSTAPTWHNVIDGQVNLFDAIRRRIDFTSPEGKEYRLNDETAVLMVRPRGLHLPERHLRLGGKPIPGALLDFGLFLFHNHEALGDAGTQPYFYLPKLEHREEAQWWNEVMQWAEDRLDLMRGTIRVTVLIETLPAVFQMHEILHALRERMLGLNCGRWDYIFSYIKTLRQHADRVLPDRGQVTMTVPFLRAYSRLLIQTCHRRGAFAMGGMAAQIPIKNDPERNERAMEKVRADKQREAGDGHDGTWVAHPGLVSMAQAEFDAVLTGPNQIDRQIDDLVIAADELIKPCCGTITEDGLRGNVRVSIQYMASWLSGNGCVPIDNLMEDAATAEISRAQLWQWVHHGSKLNDGRAITNNRLRDVFAEELSALEPLYPETLRASLRKAAGLLLDMSLGDEFATFLTLPAYARLND